MSTTAADRKLVRLVRGRRGARKRAALLLLALPAAAAVSASALVKADESDERGPVVVELFTSQSCSSCPPAEALFRDIAGRADVVALEWHVDYWNDISAGADGRWKDPFSSPENTSRQRAYNLKLRGTASVYTPQIVIDGARETVGSNSASINALIKAARSTAARAEVVAVDDVFVVKETPHGASALMVKFKRAAQTRVRGGENANKGLHERNVVVEAKPLGRLSAGARFEQPALDADHGCALLIVDQASGAAVGGAYCSE